LADEVVLIIEDNEKNLKLARAVLTLKGFRVIAAQTACEGIAKAGTDAPDVILMDIQLPDMSGLEALSHLRADPATAGLPVVALTAFAMRDDAERMLRAGFDAYISKPIDVREFPNQVRRQCELARAKRGA
jgi:two-component system cell cycle response regulator DivK